jgi:hypothetical protein
MLTLKNTAQAKNILERRMVTKSGANRTQEIREGRLQIQPDITNNAAINKTPLKTKGTRNNLVNNRLILKTTRTLAVEPHLKKKVMRKRPTEYIYRDRVINNYINPDYPDSQYDPYYNAYVANYYSALNPYPKSPHPNDRFPYWTPLWQQFYDPYIRMYDMRVLVPITNNNLGIFATSANMPVKSSNSSNRSKHSLRLNESGTSKYAPFSEAEPIPIIVKRKDPLNLAADDPTTDKKIKEKFFENFRLPSTYRYQNRIHRVNHLRGPSRAMSNRYINSPTRLMRYHHSDKHRYHHSDKHRYHHSDKHRYHHSDKHRHHHSNKHRHRFINRTNNYYGGGSGSYWGGYPYYNIGPYGYYPFSQYYYYDNNNVLPFDLRNALLPIYDYGLHPVVNHTNPANTDSTKTESAKTESAKTESAKTDSIKTESAKTNSTKTDSTKTDSAKTNSVRTNSSVKLNIENFENNSNSDIEYFSEKEVPIPEGYKLIILRFIEVEEVPNNNSRCNIIFIFILIFVFGYLLTQLHKSRK